MQSLIIPKPLLQFIDQVKGYRCRASYILKCIDYIKINNIDINQYYENKNDYEGTERTKRGRTMSGN